jgi:hypothetical protein
VKPIILSPTKRHSDGLHVGILRDEYSGRGGRALRLLERAFPGATIIDWDPLPPQLTGRGLKTKERENFFEALVTNNGQSQLTASLAFVVLFL